ncbi:MAG: response regulator [Syntrophaceae bacterium]|nr:response regulator [Syntrophaceae bacterium]
MSEKDVIMVVDDDPITLDLLADLLSVEGFRVRPFNSGEAALESLASQKPMLILLDINMPAPDGFEVCRRLKENGNTRDIPVIFVSGVPDHREKMKGFSLGAVDFISKPFQHDELLARVRTHIELVRLRGGLETQVALRTEELLRSYKQVQNLLSKTVEAIAAVVEAKDPYTAGHQQRVAELARSIAVEMGLAAEQIDGLGMASLVHDIGKISIPSEILSMPRKLTPIEFVLIKNHVQAGYDILKGIEFPWPIAKIILEHHERMDGSGYPVGLTGESLLLESRILAVADVVEAMASHRPYRPAFGISIVLEELAKGRGTLFDPVAVDSCLRLFNEKEYRIQSAGNAFPSAMI